MDIDFQEYMRALTEDYLPTIAERVTPEEMPELFYRVNLLRRASRDAVHVLLELEAQARP